MLIDNYSWIFL